MGRASGSGRALGSGLTRNSLRAACRVQCVPLAVWPCATCGITTMTLTAAGLSLSASESAAHGMKQATRMRSIRDRNLAKAAVQCENLAVCAV